MPQLETPYIPLSEPAPQPLDYGGGRNVGMGLIWDIGERFCI